MLEAQAEGPSPFVRPCAASIVAVARFVKVVTCLRRRWREEGQEGQEEQASGGGGRGGGRGAEEEEQSGGDGHMGHSPNVLYVSLALHSTRYETRLK